VRALPFVLAFLAGALVTPPALRALAAAGRVQDNWRGRALPFPAGAVAVAAALLALVPLAALHELAGADIWEPEIGLVCLYGLGVALLGLMDDLLGAGGPRGLRGHGAAVLRGSLSTGALKAAGALGLALLVLGDRGLGHGEYLLAVFVLVGATHLFNLLDLRPGRAIKVLVALGAGLAAGTWSLRPAAALGLLLAPLLVVGLHDLRERAMLGDTGSSLAGALAGLWLVLALGATGQAVALGVILVVIAYGELRSISALVERIPVLRTLDQLGRPA
jgi:UDP-N-acetylmuramyl pentapeptide phosphotransferase/UDP-N-acetylglucosamine-1-phosphate transferase